MSQIPGQIKILVHSNNIICDVIFASDINAIMLNYLDCVMFINKHNKRITGSRHVDAIIIVYKCTNEGRLFVLI